MLNRRQFLSESSALLALFAFSRAGVLHIFPDEKLYIKTTIRLKEDLVLEGNKKYFFEDMYDRNNYHHQVKKAVNDGSLCSIFFLRKDRSFTMISEWSSLKSYMQFQQENSLNASRFLKSVKTKSGELESTNINKQEYDHITANVHSKATGYYFVGNEIISTYKNKTS